MTYDIDAQIARLTENIAALTQKRVDAEIRRDATIASIMPSTAQKIMERAVQADPQYVHDTHDGTTGLTCCTL